MKERRKGMADLEKKVDNLDTRMLGIELGQKTILTNDLPHIKKAIEAVDVKVKALNKRIGLVTGLTLAGLALIGILIALLACMITIGIFQ